MIKDPNLIRTLWSVVTHAFPDLKVNIALDRTPGVETEDYFNDQSFDTVAIWYHKDQMAVFGISQDQLRNVLRSALDAMSPAHAALDVALYQFPTVDDVAVLRAFEAAARERRIAAQVDATVELYDTLKKSDKSSEKVFGILLDRIAKTVKAEDLYDVLRRFSVILLDR